MLPANPTTAGYAVLLGIATAWTLILGASVAFTILEYRDLKKPDARHRDAIPAFVSYWVAIDWREVPRVFGRMAAYGSVVALLSYLLAVGVQEVSL